MARSRVLQGLAFVTAALAFLGGAGTPSAHATVYTWDNGGGDMAWSTANNWNVAGANPANPPTSTDTAAFTGTQPGTVTVTGSTTAGTVSFSNASGAYNLSGGTLYLNQGAIQQTGAVTATNTIASAVTMGGSGTLGVTVDGGQLNLNGLLTGFSGGLVKNGAGTLVLGAADTYTGSTTINGGTLKLGILNAVPALPLTINGSALDLGGFGDTVTTLAMNSGSISNSGSAATLTLGGSATFTGTNVAGTGANIDLGGASRLFTVSNGVTTFNGALTGNYTVTKGGSGTMVMANGGANLTGTGGVLVNTGSLRIGANNTNIGNLNYVAPANAATAAGIVDLSGNNLNVGFLGPQATSKNASYGVIRLNGGTVTLGNGNANDTTNYYYPTLIGSGTLAKTGTGTMFVDPSSGWTGGIAVLNGMLELNDNNGGTDLAPVFASVFTQAGGTLNLNPGGNNESIGALSGTGGTLTESGGGYIGIGQDNSSSTYGGVVSAIKILKVGSGTLNLTGSSNNLGNRMRLIAGTLLVSSGGYLGLPTASTIWFDTGTLTLDNTNTNSNSRVNNNPALVFGGGGNSAFSEGSGGTLSLIGNAAGTTQSMTGAITLYSGANHINVTSNGAAATLTLGSWSTFTANGGGTMEIGLNGGNAGVTFGTAASATNNILPRMTIGNDWATNSGPNTATTAYAGYTDASGTFNNTSSATNLRLTAGGTLSAASTVYTVKIAPSGSGQTLNLGGFALTMAAPGLLFTGSYDFTINSGGAGGTLGASGSEVLVINKSASNVLNINAPISGGAGAVAFSGGGTTVLGAANAYTGSTYFNGGTVKLGVAGALSSTTSAFVNNTGTFDLNGYNQTLSDANALNFGGGTVTNSSVTAATLTLGGNILVQYSGASAITGSNLTVNLGGSQRSIKIGGSLSMSTGSANDYAETLTIGAVLAGTGGGFNLTGGYGTLILTNSATNTGADTVAAGNTLIIQNSGALGTTAGATTVGSGGVLILQDPGSSGLSVPENLTISSSGYQDANGKYYYQGALRNQIGNNTLSGVVTLGAANTYLGVDSGATLTLTGQLAGSYSWNKIGSGMLVLSNAGTPNNFGVSGYAANVIEGTLQLGQNNQINDGQSVQINYGTTFDMNGKTETIANLGDWNGAGGTLALSGTSGNAATLTMAQTLPYTFSGNITGTGSFTLQNANAWTLAGSSTFTGTANVATGATLVLASTNALGNGAILNPTGGTVNVIVNSTAGAIVGTGGSIGNAGANLSTLTLAAAGGSYTQGSTTVIGGNLALVKDGAYTQTLSASNTYTGGTTLKAGKLILTSTSALGTGSVTLSGGTLAGGATGGFTGDLVSGSAAHTISPGDHGSIGVLSVGSLYLNSNATLDFSDITSTSTMDRIAATGSLNFSGTGTATINVASSLAIGSYKLIDFTSAGNALASNFTIPGAPTTYSLSIDTTNWDLDLNVSAANYWKGAGGANWSSTGSWASTVPNAAGALAYFNGTGTSPAIVDTTVTIGTLQYNGSVQYTISGGGGTLTFSQTGGANATITLLSAAAQQTISAPVALATDLTVTSNALGLTMSGNISETSTGRSITLAGGLLVLQGTNGYTGYTNINGGTLQMGSINAAAPASTLVMSAGGTFDLNTNSQIIGGLSGAGGTVTSGGAATLTINQVGNTTFSGLLTGGLSLTKSGAGTLVLSGTGDNYSGATTIGAGLLQLGSTAALPAATALILSGGTLDLNGNRSTVASLSGASGTVTSGGAATLTINQVGNTTFSGLLTGGLGLTKSGAGTLVLSGTGDNYSGATTIGAGLLQLGSTAALPAATALTLSGGTLDLQTYSNSAGALTLSGGTLIGSASAVLSLAAADLQTGMVSANLGGAMNLTKSAGGAVVLSGTNSYSGTTAISAGTLQLGSTAALPAATALTLSGGTLDLNGNSSTVASLSGTGGTVTTSTGTPIFTINQAGTTTFGGLITGGSLSLVKSGAGSLTISGASNNYGGGTTLAGGILVLSNAAGSALGTGGLTLNGGTLSNVGATGSLSGDVSAGSGLHTISPGGSSAQGVLHTGSLVLSSNTTLDFSQITAGNTTTLDQILANGSLNVSGTATVIVPTNLTLGTYPVITFTSLGGGVTTSNFAFFGGTPTGYSFVLQAGDLAVKMTPNNWIGLSGARWDGAATGNWSFSTVPNGTGAVASFAGDGTAAVPVDGTITVGTIAFDGSQPYNIQPGTSSSLVFDNGGPGATVSTTNAAAAQTISAPVTLSSDLTISNNSPNSLTFSGGITGTNHNLTLAAGLLILQGTNTYSGTTNVAGGTLQAGALNALSANATLVTSAGGTVDLNSNSQTIAGLSGTGGTVSSSGAVTLTVNQAGTTTYSGLVTGAVGLTMSGGGTLQLNASNSYTGATNINQGTVTLGVATAIPATGGVNINTGGTLNRGGQTVASTGLNLAGGSIGGTGTLSMAGDMTGYGTVTGGSINLNSGSRTMNVTGSNSLTIADQITGTGPLTQGGSGTLVLNNTNTASAPNNWTGGLTLNGGTLQNGYGNQVPDGLTVTVGAAAIWDLNGQYEKITSLAPLANGTAGGININGGTLEITTAANGTHYGILGATGTLVLDGGNSITDNNNGGAEVFKNWSFGGSIILNSGATLNVAHGETTTAEINASDIYINAGGILAVNGQTTTGMGLAATTKIHMNGGVYDMASTYHYDTDGGNQVLGGLDGSSGTVSNNSNTHIWTLTINQTSGTSTYGGQLTNGANALNVVKSGGGTWILSNTSASHPNNYSGTTQVAGGTLQLDANEQIPNGSLFTVSTGGTFNLGGFSETLAAPTLAGGTIAGAGTLTYTTSMNFQSGLLTANLGGTAAMVKTGTGTGLLGAANVLSGTAPLTVSNGTLDLQSYNQTVPVLTMTGGTLAGTGGAVLSVSANADLQSGTLNAPLVGAGNLTKSAGGTFVLSGSNGYGGSTTVSAGTLQLGSNNALPTTTTLTVGGGTLDIQGYTPTVSRLTLSGGTISGGGSLNFGTSADVRAGTIAAVITGGNLVKSTSGTAVLTAAGTYTGGTIISNGTLLISNTSGLSVLGTGAVTLSGGTLAGAGTISGNVSAGSGAHAIAPMGTLTTGSLYLSSNTTLDFSNLMSVATIASTGSLNVLATGSDVVHIAVPSGLLADTYKLVDAASAGNATDANFALLGGARPGFSLTTSAGDLFLTIIANYWKGPDSGNWSEAGNWNVGVPNAVASTANFTGVGGTTVVIDTAATLGSLQFATTASYEIRGPQALTFDNTGAGGNATILMSGTAAAQTVSAAVVLASDVTVTSNSSGVTIAGPISGANHGLTLASGLLVLSNSANTYSGNTNVSGGTLQMGGLNAASSASTVVMSNGGTFDLNAFSQVVGGLSGAGGTVTSSSLGTPVLSVIQTGTSTFSGVMIGSMALEKSGAGTLILGVANSYTGDTTVDAGTLKMGIAGAASAASAVLMNSGVFDLNGYSQVIGGLSGAGGTVTSAAAATLTVNQTTSAGYSGLISGALALTKSGADTLVLGAANSYTGGTNINAGTLKLGVAGAVPITGGVLINTGGMLDRNGFNLTPAGLTLNGGTITGTGTLAVNADLTGFGAITGGTVDLGGGTLPATGTRRIINIASGTLTIGDAITDGNLQKEGGGTLVLTNSANAFTASGFGIFNAGVVQNGASEVLGDVTYNVENIAQWDLNGYYETISGFSSGTDTGTINLNGGTLRVDSYGGSYNGSIVGAGATGTFIMAASVTGGFQGIQSLNNSAGYTFAQVIQQSGNLQADSLTGVTLTAASIELQSGTVGIGGLRLSSTSSINKTTTGTVLVGSAGVFSTSPLAVTNGVLNLQTYNQAAPTLTLTGGTLIGTTAVLTLGTSADIQAGVLAARLAGGTVSKSTTGTVLMGAAGVLSGTPLVVSAGTLDVQSYNQIVSTLTMAGGTLAGTGGGILGFGTSADIQAGAISANLGGGGDLTKSTTSAAILSGSNNYGGSTTVSAGTLQLGSTAALPVTTDLVVGGGALDLQSYSNTVETLTVTGGTVTGAGSAVLNVNTSIDLEAGLVSANMGGGAGLTKTGAGSLILTGNSTYTGPTTVQQGLLKVNAGASLVSAVTVQAGGAIGGAGTVGGLTLSGGTLRPGGASSIGTLSVNGDASLLGGSTYQWKLSSVSGANQDGLSITGNLALGASSGSPITVDITSLGLSDFSNTAVYNWVIASAGSVSGFDPSAYVLNTVNFGFTPTGTFSISQSGSELVLTYTGVTTEWVWTGGTSTWGTGSNWAANSVPGSANRAVFDTAAANQPALLASDSALAVDFRTAGWVISNSGGAGTVLTIGSGGLTSTSTAAGTNTIAVNVALGASQAWTANSGNVVAVTGVLALGGNTLTMNGTGTVQLGGSGAGSDSGILNVNAGLVQLTASNVLGTGVDVNVNGATLDILGNANTVDAVSLNGGTILGSGGVLSANAFNVQSGLVTAVLAGGSLNKTTGGTVILSGANTYTGATYIQAGLLQAGAANVISTASAVTVSGAFDLNGFNQSVGSVAGAGSITLGAGTLTTGSDGTSTAYSGTITGPGGVVKTGVGTWTLSNAGNTYGGGTTILGGLLQLGASNALPTGGNVTISGGELDLQANNNTVGAVSLTAGTIAGSGTLTGSAFAVQSGVVTAILAGSGATLTKSTSGVAVLSGVNTFTGATDIQAGSLQAGAANILTSSSAVTVETSGQFNLNNFSQTVRSIGGAGSVYLGGGTLTEGSSNASTTSSGAISGTTGGLVKVGAGTWTLSNASNAFSGPVAIDGGIVSVASAGALGDGTSTNNLLLAGGELMATGNVSSGRAVSVTGAGNVVDVAAGNTVTFSGAFGINSGATLTKTDLGTLTISGTQNNGSGSALVLSGGTTNLSAVGTSNTQRYLSVTDTSATLVVGKTQYLASLVLTSSAKASLSSSGTSTASNTIKTDALSIDGTSLLDVKDSNLVINRASMSLTQVEAKIKAGEGTNSGGVFQWDGTNGITSSAAKVGGGYTALGVWDLGIPLTGRTNPTSLEGVPTDATSILVKYTWIGDMNLDGKVTVDDYAMFLYDFINQGGLTMEWATGDFNGDGKIDVNDYAMFLAGYTAQSGTLSAGQQITSSEIAQGYDLLTPEPATLVLLTLGGLAALANRRRNRVGH